MNTPQIAYRCDEHGTRLGRCCTSAMRVFPPEEEMSDDARPAPESVLDILERAKATVRDREAIYGGDGYKIHGAVLALLFPKGIFLHDAEDFARFKLFNMIIAKVCRYAQQYQNGGHADSIHDLGVYAFKMEEHDAGNRHGC